jgi:ankyrin repeat protein
MCKRQNYNLVALLSSLFALFCQCLLVASAIRRMQYLRLVVLVCLCLWAGYSKMLVDEATREMWQCLGLLSENKIVALLHEGVDVNSRGTDGKTFLILASEYGMTDTVQALIKHGADVNAKDDHGNTALMLARQSGNREICDLLVKHGTK